MVSVGLPMTDAIVERSWLRKTWTGQFPMLVSIMRHLQAILNVPSVFRRTILRRCVLRTQTIHGLGESITQR